FMRVPWPAAKITAFMKGRLRPGKGVGADKQIARAKRGGAFQQEYCPHPGPRKRKPGPAQLPPLRPGPGWNIKSVQGGQGFGGGRQESVVSLAVRDNTCQARRFLDQPPGTWLCPKLIQKIAEDEIEGFAC